MRQDLERVSQAAAALPVDRREFIVECIEPWRSQQKNVQRRPADTLEGPEGGYCILRPRQNDTERFPVDCHVWRPCGPQVRDFSQIPAGTPRVLLLDHPRNSRPRAWSSLNAQCPLGCSLVVPMGPFKEATLRVRADRW